MERNEWLEARRTGIGGSDIAAVCGLSRWKSPMSVYLDKIQAVDQPDDNEFFYWGRAAERMVAERFSEDHPEFVLVCEEFQVIQRKDFPWMLATPDGLIYPPHDDGDFAVAIAGWECKTASAFKKGEWDGVDIPQEYWLQCQWYMAVTDLSRWFLSVLIGGNDYREWEIEREPDAISMMMRRGEDFWANHVVPQVPPPVDGSHATTDALGKLYPADKVEDDIVVLEDGADGLAVALLAARADLKLSQGVVDNLENQLKALMASHAVGMTPMGYEIDWKPRARVGVDSKKLKESYPTIYEAVTKTTEFRVFGIKPPREEKSDG